MKRAIGYVRVSTPGQAERGYSIEEQEAMIRRHAERQGYTLVELVHDAGESGQLEHRPGLKRIQELARTRAADVAIVTVIDRVGRAARIILNTLHDIRTRGVSVEYTDLSIDTSTPEGRLQETFHAGLAEYRMEQLRAEMLKGKRGKLARSRLPSNWRCFGYRMITVAEARAIPEKYAGLDGTAELVSEQAELVREMFTQYARGERTIRGLALWLNAQGVRTINGRTWGQSGVRTILLNPAYKGTVVWNQHLSKRVEDPDTGRKHKVLTRRPEDEWGQVPVPPIVDEVIWQQVQERLRSNREQRSGRPPGPEYALAGLIYCGVCRKGDGKPLRLSAYKRRRGGGMPRERYYTCCSRSLLNREYCGVELLAERIEEKVYRHALAELAPGRLSRLARQRLETEQRNVEGLRSELARAEKALADLRTQGQRLAGAVAAGVLSLEDAEPQSRRIQAERNTLQTRVRELEGSLARVQDPAEAEVRVEAAAARWRAELLAAKDDPARLRSIYEQFLRVSVSRSRIADIEVRVG